MNKLKFLLITPLLTLALPTYAQEGNLLFPYGIGSFFACIVAGILLAFAFQFLLTNLAVALGITMIGDVTDTDHSSSDHSSKHSKDDDSTGIGVKLANGMGAFFVVTMVISLFLASLVAVKLSLTPNNTVGFTLGLIIWAGYLLLGLYLDAKMISSISGSVFSLVKGALTTGTSAIGGMFSSSKQTQMKDTARETVKAIHEELNKEFDLSDFEKKMDKYVKKLKPKQYDLNDIQDKLSELLHDIEVREKYTPEDPEATKKLFLEVASKQDMISAEDKKKLGDAFDKAKEAFKGDGSKSDKAINAFDKLTPGSEQQSKEYREKIEQYLKQSGREEIDPDQLQQDLEKIIDDPKGAPDVILSRINQIDRSTIKAMVASNTSLSEDKVDSYINKAENVIDQIRRKANDAMDASKDKIDQAKNKVSQSTSGNSESTMGQSSEGKAKGAIEKWFDKMNRPELRYDLIKHDAQRMMNDPKATPSILRNRLNRMDRNSLIALVSNNPAISKDQAEQAVDKIEEARDEVVKKVDEMERMAKEKIAQAKHEALRQAEGARKAAAAAAWWFFGAAILSGAASAVGGMLSLSW